MVEMVYDDGSEPAYRDYGQLDNAPDGIPARDVDAALRRIEKALHDLPPRFGSNAFIHIQRIVTEERERLGLPAEIKV